MASVTIVAMSQSRTGLVQALSFEGARTVSRMTMGIKLMMEVETTKMGEGRFSGKRSWPAQTKGLAMRYAIWWFSFLITKRKESTVKGM